MICPKTGAWFENVFQNTQFKRNRDLQERANRHVPPTLKAIYFPLRIGDKGILVRLVALEVRCCTLMYLNKYVVRIEVEFQVCLIAPKATAGKGLLAMVISNESGVRVPGACPHDYQSIFCAIASSNLMQLQLQCSRRLDRTVVGVGHCSRRLGSVVG